MRVRINALILDSGAGDRGNGVPRWEDETLSGDGVPLCCGTGMGMCVCVWMGGGGAGWGEGGGGTVCVIMIVKLRICDRAACIGVRTHSCARGNREGEMAREEDCDFLG